MKFFNPVRKISATLLLLALFLLAFPVMAKVDGEPDTSKLDGLKDLGFRELMIMAPLVVLIIGLGVYPKPVFERIEPSVGIILERIEATTDHIVPERGTPDGIVEVDYGPISESPYDEHEGDG